MQHCNSCCLEATLNLSRAAATEWESFSGVQCTNALWEYISLCVTVSVLSAWTEKELKMLPHIRFKTCFGPGGSAQSGMQRMVGKQGPVKMWTCLCSLSFSLKSPSFSVSELLLSAALVDSRPLGDALLGEIARPVDESWKRVSVFFFLLRSQRRHEDIILVVSHGR